MWDSKAWLGSLSFAHVEASNMFAFASFSLDAAGTYNILIPTGTPRHQVIALTCTSTVRVWVSGGGHGGVRRDVIPQEMGASLRVRLA